MVEWVKALLERPWVAHLLRALERFNARLGKQFAAAMAYFSLLAVVPIVMFAFAVTGFVLELRPDLLQMVKDEVGKALSGDEATQGISQTIDNALSGWRSIGVTSLLLALYTGSNWVGNLKSAIRAQWRPNFDMAEDKRNIVVETLVNAGLLVVLLFLVALTFALASAGTALNTWLIGLLGLQDVTWVALVFRAGPILLSIISGWLLFSFIFWVFPQVPVPARSRAIGALVGAVGLAVLQYGAGLLAGAFSGNAAAKVFGPVVVVMLVINLFGTLTLMVAAWIATTDQPATPERDEHKFDPHSQVQGPSMPPPAHRTRALGTARRRVGSVPESLDWEPGQGQPWVTQDVARTSVKAGLGAGWVAGAAAGLGLGATVAGALGKLRRKPKD